MLIRRLINSVKSIDIFLLSGLITFSLLLTHFYISQEQYYYYWDYARSFQQLNDLIDSFQKSALEGIGLLLISLFDDYTQLPSIPLLPLRIILGGSRLGFISGLVLAYVIPFSLIMGLTLSRIILVKPRLVFWSTSLFSLLIPSVWIPIFRGFPDIGGSALISLAILNYWQDSNLKTKNQRIFIAFLLGIAVLFRRHFIYSVRALILTIIIYKLIEISPKYRRRVTLFLKYLKIFSLRIAHVLFLFGAFSFIVIIKALFINYRALYSSYEASATSNAEFYIQAFGLIICVSSITGFICAQQNKSIDRRTSDFLFLFGLISIIQWLFFAKQINIQYVTHFLTFIIPGNYLLIHIIFSKFNQPIRNTFLIFSMFFYSLNFLCAIGTNFKFIYPISLLFSKKESPLFRQDYESVASLVKYLRVHSNSSQKIYVAASSYTLNYSVFTVAEQQLFGKSTLPISRNSNIDSRDFYPLNGLLQAHYVVVASPYQYHIDPKEQTVVKVVVDAFKENWAIAQDFTPLPQTFALEHGVTVRIYERIRPTSFTTILETLAKMRSQVSRIPGQEPYWLDLQSEQPSAIIQDSLLRMVQVLRLQITNKTPTSLLYFGKIPEQAKITGLYSIIKCPNTSGSISLQISTLDKNGTVLAQTKKNYSKSELAPFELQITGQNAAFIRLSLRVNSNNQSLISSCRAELNLLKVSQQ
jgi:hypothetical protein